MSKYTTDGKYLAVINKNGLWIRDKINDKILIVNSSKIDENYLINNFITEFDVNYKVIRNIKSDKINIKSNEWKILNPEIFIKNTTKKQDYINIYSNFYTKRINSLFSNLSSLSFLELLELKNNYESLNYSTIDIDVQIHKIISYPFYLILMTIFSAIIMFNSKEYRNNTLKISIGLFFCNNLLFKQSLYWNNEKINHILSIWLPLLILSFLIMLKTREINEK